MSIWGARLCLILCTAAGVLFAGCGGSGTVEDKDHGTLGNDIPQSELVIARVGGSEITIGDVYDKLRIQYPKLIPEEGSAGYNQMREILKIYVQELCMVDMAKNLGFEESERYKKTVEFAKRYVLADLLLQEVFVKNSEPTEEQVLKFYNENEVLFTTSERVMVRHIMTETEDEANQVRNLLLNGGNWDKLAGEYSIDKPSGHQGGKVGAVTRDGEIMSLGKAPEFNRVVFSLQVGEISRPFKTKKGWHIAEVTENRPESKRPLESVRDQIVERLQKVNMMPYKQAVLDSLHVALDVAVYEDVLEDYRCSLMTEEELLGEARRAKDSKSQIRFYQEILDRMPESSRCPEALFMVGYINLEEFGDKDAARKSFEELIRRFPGDALVASSQWILEHPGEALPDTEKPAIIK
ncbi:MAG: peptidyl-prolyl cis-trans isomerase [Candidatus Eisenbacteria bacterium]|uniref:Peptidyl-prolyl cis-trans isomerase n=1 Tax=Eiseniibacteriota bacterium TaxID=2212470 RepID=A0A948RU68_UNCEI|nr:peptidyl-prolyl cis-trans isomerase [Candidatus Eisenbacteria bacterium]MBU1950663.1 peptidyl-prolyl cis-trans isomerase [Candidatus Eisenbacteria bacterium]MBU2689638.1 peptidyl-prolyl cis-trans isomerase [Candidatus Eisenbacteria bacterium]